MNETFFKISIAVLVVLFIAERIPFVRKTKKVKKTVRKSPARERVMVLTNWFGMVFFPFIYAFSRVFDGLSMGIHDYLRIGGIAVYVFALVLLFLSHKGLHENWSMGLEIGEEHKLINTGIYSKIRHPMYTAFMLMMAGQLFIVSNWFVGMFGVCVWVLLLILRTSDEEKMLIEEFGDEYREYMKKTKMFIPYIF